MTPFASCQRDDEVWAMIAFLHRMPSLDAAAYRELVYGKSDPTYPVDRPARRAVREVCWRCHGIDGTGRGAGAFPSLAGQRSTYLYESLRAFAGPPTVQWDHADGGRKPQ